MFSLLGAIHVIAWMEFVRILIFPQPLLKVVRLVSPQNMFYWILSMVEFCFQIGIYCMYYISTLGHWNYLYCLLTKFCLTFHYWLLSLYHVWRQTVQTYKGPVLTALWKFEIIFSTFPSFLCFLAFFSLVRYSGSFRLFLLLIISFCRFL